MLPLQLAVPDDLPLDDAPRVRLRGALDRAAGAARLQDAGDEPRFLVQVVTETALGTACEVLVVCDVPSPGERAVRLERALTAAQRYMLSLWADGYDARWEAPAGGGRAAIAGEVVVGRVLVAG
ncbi:MAG: hypothetical protein ACK41D_01150 [Rubricoccaceae bacterium]